MRVGVNRILKVQQADEVELIIEVQISGKLILLMTPHPNPSDERYTQKQKALSFAK